MDQALCWCEAANQSSEFREDLFRILGHKGPLIKCLHLPGCECLSKLVAARRLVGMVCLFLLFPDDFPIRLSA